MSGLKFSERIKELKLRHFIVLFVAFIIFFGSIFGIYNYRQEQIKPAEITITSPAQGGGIYQSDKIVIEGETKRNTEVRVGDVSTTSDEIGKFYFEVPLEVGENKLKIEAGSGREYNSSTVIVFREAPVEEKREISTGLVPPGKSLNETGPETLWLPELILLTGSSLLYFAMKKKLKRARSSSIS